MTCKITLRKVAVYNSYTESQNVELAHRDTKKKRANEVSVFQVEYVDSVLVRVLTSETKVQETCANTAQSTRL